MVQSDEPVNAGIYKNGITSASKPELHRILVLRELLCGMKKRREELNYSQEYLAAKLNISQKTYSKLELGKSQLSLSRFLDVCAILEIEINDLLKSNS